MARQRRHVPYTIKSGDTLWGIAEQFLGAGTEWPRIYDYSNLLYILGSIGQLIEDPNLIHPGNVLYLPVGSGASRARSGGQTDSLGEPYIVKPGDTLSGIALNVLGSANRWSDIYEHNNRPEVVARTGQGIKDANLIYPRQRLLIPVRPPAVPTPGRGRLKAPPPEKAKPPPWGSISGQGEGRGTLDPPPPGPWTRPQSSSRNIESHYRNNPYPTQGFWPRFTLPFALWVPAPEIPIAHAETLSWKAELFWFGGLWITIGAPFSNPYATFNPATPSLGAFTKRQIDETIARLYVDYLLTFNMRTGKLYYRSIYFARIPGFEGAAVGVGFKIEGGVPTLRYEIRIANKKARFDWLGLPAFAHTLDLRAVAELTWKGPPLPPPPRPPKNLDEVLRWIRDSFPVPRPASGPAVVSATPVSPSAGPQPKLAPPGPAKSPQGGSPTDEVTFHPKTLPKWTVWDLVPALLFLPIAYAMRGMPHNQATLSTIIGPGAMGPREGPPL